MITEYGTVPFPGGVDSRPIRALSSAMRSLCQSITEGASGIRDVANTSSTFGWSGPAADRFGEHITQRSMIVTLLAEVASEAAPVIEAYADAIESSQDVYSQAATAEKQARRYLPATLTVVEAAMAAEVGAIVALHAAGTAFATTLTALMLKAEAADTFGITRNPLEVVGDTVSGIIDMFAHDDVATGIVRGANTVGRVEHADGTVTQHNILGLALNSVIGWRLQAFQVVGGVLGLLDATPLSIRRADVELQDLLKPGPTGERFMLQPTNVRELGISLALTEEFQRSAGVEPDQSSVVPYSVGVDTLGKRVITMHVPGIVPPGTGSWNGSTGERNITGAALSQITGLGVVETSLRQQLANLDVKRGDRVVLYGHSYGGIAARNLANALAREGIEVAFVSYGAPNGPVEPGVEAHMVQNPNDPVPATRIGGDGIEGARYARNQNVVQVRQRAPGGLIDNHSSRFYGENLTQTPNLELDDFLRRQRLVNLTSSGMVILEGPRTPQGTPNTGVEVYRLPAPAGR
jgi:hypothetical protein